MLYLLDASLLITANNSYYPVDTVPEYWDWLHHMAVEGNVKMPIEVFEEVRDGPDNQDRDLLFAWLQEDANRTALLLEEEVLSAHVQSAVANGYGANLTDDELEVLGRDPFLLAHAMADPANRCIATVETSKPSRQRANRHLPDVCRTLGLRCCDPFTMNRDLGFRTNWRRP